MESPYALKSSALRAKLGRLDLLSKGPIGQTYQLAGTLFRRNRH